MPHFGLMEEGEMLPLDAALLRARLHFRCGIRRMSEKKYPEGISTLYDAALSGMRWFALADTTIHEKIHQMGDAILEDDITLQQLLSQHGVWPANYDFNQFQAAVYATLDGDLKEFDYTLFINQVEVILTRIGVLPFDETELPPEDPNTF